MSAGKHSIICIILLLAVCTYSLPYPGIRSRKASQTIPLTEISFYLHVFDGLMLVDITQTYHNILQDPIDAVYTFPVNYAMAVTNFTVHYERDGSTLQAKLFPKSTARQMYNIGKEEGHGAAYMGFDEEQQDMLSLELGNIEPNDTIKVKVSFVQQLSVEDLSWAVRIPTTFTPPYTGSGPVSNSATTPTVNYVAYPMKLVMEIDSSSAITRLISTSHKIATQFALGNKKARVSLENEYDAPDRDIVILYRNSLIQEPQVLIQKADQYDTYAVLLSFLPFSESRFSKEGGVIDTESKAIKYYESEKFLDSKSEFVFLIDCSGSMNGRIEQAREAAKLFIKSLPRDSYFSFVFFGTDYRIAEPGHSVKYSKETADAAWKYLSEVEANMGGTELYQALEHVLGLRKIEGYTRNILIMTDGEVTSPDLVINLVHTQSKLTNTFVHTIGIGSGASRHLVEGVANAGRGAYYFITEGEVIMPKVIEALTNMCIEQVSNAKIEWPSELVVGHVPNSGFYGRSFVAAAILKGRPEGKITLTGHKRSNGEQFKHTFDLSNARREMGTEIYKLAVKLALNEKSINDYETIEKLSMEYEVLSEATGFVSVKLYPNKTDRDKVEEIRVPVMTVKETRERYDAVHGRAASRRTYDYKVNSAAYVASMQNEEEKEVWNYQADSYSMGDGGSAGEVLLVDDIIDPVQEAEGSKSSSIKEKKEIELLEILNLLEPDGSFTLNEDIISKYFGKSVSEIKNKLSVSADDKVLATLLMLYMMEKEYPSSPELTLVMTKTLAWLEKAGVKYDAAKDEILKLAVATQKTDL